MNNEDYIIRATAAEEQIRMFCISSRNMVEAARLIHNTSPVASAALGRTLSAAAMMGISMKGEKDLLTISVKGQGALGAITVTANSKGYVKGYVEEPMVILPPNTLGKLDVGGAVGPGTLTVIKDMGLKEPYSGTIDLQTGEIADDLTYYFAVSEQIPSSVSLGVLLNKSNYIEASGGFIIQLMPFAEENIINSLEEKLKNIPSITNMLEKGLMPEDIINQILGDLGVVFLDKISTGFRCDCSAERCERALHSLGAKDRESLIEDDKPIEMKCHFCNKIYRFKGQKEYPFFTQIF